MPAAFFVDLNTIDLDQLITPKETIYERLPHRYEFMQLDGIVHLDLERQVGVGVRHVREDEFWVRGHIPGRPLLPGVLMIETAAQMASFLSQEIRPDSRFLGFGGLESVKFRLPVTPPSTLYIIEQLIEVRQRRTVCDAQGVVDGKMVFEARIIGMPI